jgi:hypothetical protein
MDFFVLLGLMWTMAHASKNSDGVERMKRAVSLWKLFGRLCAIDTPRHPPRFARISYDLPDLEYRPVFADVSCCTQKKEV